MGSLEIIFMGAVIFAIAYLYYLQHIVADIVNYLVEVFSGFSEYIKDTVKGGKPAKRLMFYPTGTGELARAHSTDAGMDIMSAEDYVLKPRERHMFTTGIHCILPMGTEVDVRPRSGLANKYGIDVMGGVIDEAYTGELRVILINHGSEDFEVKIGDKIAQLLLQDIYQTQPLKITEETFNTLKEDKDRGDNGFGSSDNKVE